MMNNNDKKRMMELAGIDPPELLNEAATLKDPKLAKLILKLFGKRKVTGPIFGFSEDMLDQIRTKYTKRLPRGIRGVGPWDGVMVSDIISLVIGNDSAGTDGPDLYGGNDQRTILRNALDGTHALEKLVAIAKKAK